MTKFIVTVDVFTIDLEVEADTEDGAASEAVRQFYEEYTIGDLEVEVFEVHSLGVGGTA